VARVTRCFCEKIAQRQKICPNHWAIFSRKKFAIKNRPNGEISPNLVTLIVAGVEIGVILPAF
jgi:hypothetical protein